MRANCLGDMGADWGWSLLFVMYLIGCLVLSESPCYAMLNCLLLFDIPCDLLM